MADLGMRPRFLLKLEDASPNEVYQKVQSHVLEGNPECIGMFRNPHMELMFKPEHRHFWSPRLSLEFEPYQESTVIRGLIGPHPSVWTMFMACYGSFGILIFVGLTLGYSQWSLQQSPWGFTMALVALVGILFSYVGSLFGQRMALEQTIRLREYLVESMGDFALRAVRLESLDPDSPTAAG
ncbi:MAG: hypothetical protein EP343_15920 [Deltaproteobacteria bacterium]|nr:MAG: hypothetical protein EP343_15920 [Deltaproteobacteria bacterium]